MATRHSLKLTFSYALVFLLMFGLVRYFLNQKPIQLVSAFGLINLAEVLLLAYALHRKKILLACSADEVGLRWVVSVFISALVCSMMGGVLAGAVMQLLDLGTFFDTALKWAISDLAGVWECLILFTHFRIWVQLLRSSRGRWHFRNNLVWVLAYTATFLITALINMVKYKGRLFEVPVIAATVLLSNGVSALASLRVSVLYETCVLLVVFAALLNGRGPLGEFTAEQLTSAEVLQAAHAYTLVLSFASALVGAVSADTRRANNALTKTLFDRTAFFSRVSHEFRTPLNVITGTIELQLKQRQLDVAPQHELMADLVGIRDASDTLKVVVDDMLQLFQNKAGVNELTVQLRSRDSEKVWLLSDLQSYALLCFSNLAQQKGLQFRAHLVCTDTRIRCDYNRIKQVCNNLIGNAIKYTYTGGVNVTIGVEVDANGCQRLCISVCDSGVGLLNAEKSLIFESFNRLERTAAEIGTGLGLSITKQMVETLGGCITVASPGLQQGCTFSVSLPIE
eukprot:8523-Heterococcus_DN1.PRE.2